jgi:hypothetical protein
MPPTIRGDVYFDVIIRGEEPSRGPRIVWFQAREWLAGSHAVSQTLHVTDGAMALARRRVCGRILNPHTREAKRPEQERIGDENGP